MRNNFTNGSISGKGIQIKTISFNETYQQPGSIEEIHRYISKTYPNIHTSDYISKTLINQVQSYMNQRYFLAKLFTFY